MSNGDTTTKKKANPLLPMTAGCIAGTLHGVGPSLSFTFSQHNLTSPLLQQQQQQQQQEELKR